MKRIIRLILGTLFLVLGVLGLFLPVLQGILFLIVGLLILAPESRRIRNLLNHFREKYPTVFEHAERLKRKFSRTGKHNGPQGDNSHPQSPTQEHPEAPHTRLSGNHD